MNLKLIVSFAFAASSFSYSAQAHEQLLDLSSCSEAVQQSVAKANQLISNFEDEEVFSEDVIDVINMGLRAQVSFSPGCEYLEGIDEHYQGVIDELKGKSQQTASQVRATNLKLSSL